MGKQKSKTGHGKVHLLVAGDGELQGKLEAYIIANSLQKSVTLLGRVDRKEMPSVMAAGDVIFLPSKMEGLAVALIEAMSLCLVPVVTNVGGHREIVVPGTGCLLNRDDEPGMLKCLQDLALDTDARKKMSQNAKAIVQKSFSFDSMKRKVQQYLSETITKVQPAAGGVSSR